MTFTSGGRYLLPAALARFTAGHPDVVLLEDRWSIVTEDGSLSAHFEHTVAITDNGPLVLTTPEEA